MSDNVNQDLEKLIQKLNRYLDNSADETVTIIPPEFVRLLQREGDKLLQLAADLAHEDQLEGWLEPVIENQAPLSVKGYMLQDIVAICRTFYATWDVSEIPVKSKFLIAYLFERLQGNDYAKTVGFSGINEMLERKDFDKSIPEILHFNYNKLKTNYQKDYVLPLILVNSNLDLHQSITSSYYRVASMIVKADDVVTNSEEELLKRLSAQINEPTAIDSPVVKSTPGQNDTLEKTLDELHALVGLDNVKTHIDELSNFLKVQKVREKEGLLVPEKSIHAVFTGPPGTGKTTVARLFSRLLKHLGYLSKGHLVETDRSGMVAGYVGQTATKVDELVSSALGGVLFIDEAYALVPEAGNGRDFGHEAIQVLLKRMEDHRNDLVVIVAGYEEEMKSFIQSNPGLQSRFNTFYQFGHYSPHEMLSIYNLLTSKFDFLVTSDAQDKLFEIFDAMYEQRNSGFGNGRIVRNIFEQSVVSQANRVVSITPLTRAVLQEISASDVPSIEVAVTSSGGTFE